MTAEQQRIAMDRPMTTSEPKPKCIVRVRTSERRIVNGLTYERQIYVLKRQSEGFDFFNEEINCVGADLTARKITNLFDVKDGVYQVILTNISKDWESGHVDDFDFELIPLQ